jgi:hypothetical protein
MRDIDDPPSQAPQEPFDPYAPPRAETDEAGDLTDDLDPQDIPLAYLDHARAIKRVSWVNFFLAVIWAPAAIGTLLMSALMVLRAVGIDPIDYQFPKDIPSGIAWVALTTFHIGCLALNIAIGIGLRRFQSWARWADIAIATFFLVICLAYAGDVVLNQKPLAWLLMTSVPGMALSGLVLLTLLSPRSRRVFSSPYRELIAQYR